MKRPSPQVSAPNRTAGSIEQIRRTPLAASTSLLKISSAPKAALDMTRIRPKSSSRSFSPETSKDLSCLPRATAAPRSWISRRKISTTATLPARDHRTRGVPASVIAQSPETVRGRHAG